MSYQPHPSAVNSVLRPYPNVKKLHNRWQAFRPNRGTKVYLGSFRTPEEARQAVLIAQAEHLEDKAADYRAEAERVVAGLRLPANHR